MKQALVVVLVIVVLLTGIPLAMGLPMADCADCDLGVLTASACLAILGTASFLFLAGMATRVLVRAVQLEGRLVPFGLERPPRLA